MIRRRNLSSFYCSFENGHGNSRTDYAHLVQNNDIIVIIWHYQFSALAIMVIF